MGAGILGPAIAAIGSAAGSMGAAGLSSALAPKPKPLANVQPAQPMQLPSHGDNMQQLASLISNVGR